MSSDLPDGLLGSADGDREGDGSSGGDEEERTFHRFLFLEIGRHELAIPVADVRAVTDPPAERTRIPRTPPAIDGITDIRGQITVLVDPHVHFPDSGGPSATASLLVFDRPDQPAAIVVDEIHGVEAVPEDDLLGVDEFDPDEIDGTALAHPLVVGLIRRERRARDLVVDAIASGPASRETAETDGPTESITDRLHGGRSTNVDDEFGVEVDEFSLEEEEAAEESEPEPVQADVEVEVTPLLDVDRLLLASGRVAESDLENVGAAGGQ